MSLSQENKRLQKDLARDWNKSRMYNKIKLDTNWNRS
jgi:hypothetical protein